MLIKAERLSDGKTVWIDNQNLNVETHRLLADQKPAAKKKVTKNAKADKK
jgi:hypothetical protein